MASLTHVEKLHEKWLAYVTRHSWMTAEALIIHGPKFAKEAPRQGWAWHEAAEILSEAGKFPEALALWEEAVKFAEMDPKRYSVFQSGRIKALLKLKRNDDASKAIKLFDKKRLLPTMDEEFEALKKRAVPGQGRQEATV
ncbi:MAG: tetratricopeptide (TPR) repeat protein [Verrucomicrobiales bacterium]|jgi:tetratricopeptide (TPR) repeat protein